MMLSVALHLLMYCCLCSAVDSVFSNPLSYPEEMRER